MSPILEVKNLNVGFPTPEGIVHAVNNVSFSVKPKQVLGIVGESGSGKSQTVLAIMGLLAKKAQVSGSIQFMGQELLSMRKSNLNKIRGNLLSIVFQEAMASLNPYLTIKSQMVEILKLHKGYSSSAAAIEAIQMLDFVKIPDAKRRINLYPHEFSGGMQQRVMIAMALLCKPKLLIADEPTTALDVTIQEQILQIMEEMKCAFDMAIILITHDMGVVARICNQVNVMYCGQIMESATVNEIFYAPKHPYTQALLASIPHLAHKTDRLANIEGEPPNLANLPMGCVFQSRCSQVHEACKNANIPTQEAGGDHLYTCNLP